MVWEGAYGKLELLPVLFPDITSALEGDPQVAVLNSKCCQLLSMRFDQQGILKIHEQAQDIYRYGLYICTICPSDSFRVSLESFLVQLLVSTKVTLFQTNPGECPSLIPYFSYSTGSSQECRKIMLYNDAPVKEDELAVAGTYLYSLFLRMVMAPAKVRTDIEPAVYRMQIDEVQSEPLPMGSFVSWSLWKAKQAPPDLVRLVVNERPCPPIFG
ncbi:MAG: hypothetical protein LBC25_00730 [Holosporales bacterium]|jgi:hypothetical protein|nr:hypothetical protein [Holosporales bacterium]